jgi:hypothetical protein
MLGNNMPFSVIKKSHKKQGYGGYPPMSKPAPAMTSNKLIPKNSPLKAASGVLNFKSIKTKLRKK